MLTIQLSHTYWYIKCLPISGWFIVWKVFLSRFKFVRELLGTNNDSQEAQTSTKSGNTRSTARPKKVRLE